MAVLPFTLPSVAGWPKIWGPQDERCPISIVQGDMRDSEAHWRRYACTWKWCSEECTNFYRIESVENNADELKTILCS